MFCCLPWDFMILTCFLDNRSLSTLPSELHETYLKNLVIHKTPHERSAKEATRQLFLRPSLHSNLILFSICVLENDTIRIDFDWLSHQQPAFCYACRQHLAHWLRPTAAVSSAVCHVWKLLFLTKLQLPVRLGSIPLDWLCLLTKNTSLPNFISHSSVNTYDAEISSVTFYL